MTQLQIPIFQSFSTHAKNIYIFFVKSIQQKKKKKSQLHDTIVNVYFGECNDFVLSPGGTISKVLPITTLVEMQVSGESCKTEP